MNTSQGAPQDAEQTKSQSATGVPSVPTARVGANREPRPAGAPNIDPVVNDLMIRRIIAALAGLE